MLCYLHIGTMKTGTSSIQDFLYINKERLKQQGYLYPTSIKGHWHLNDHNPFAYAMESYIECEHISDNMHLLALRDEIILEKLDKIIISTENIQFLLHSIESIEKLKKFLNTIGFKEIKIIVYVRNQADLFISMCSQSTKDNDIKEYISTPKQNEKFQIICNHEKTIKNWSRVFGEDNLIVRIFDKQEFIERDLIRDFTCSIGIKWSEDFVISNSNNKALNLIGMEILQRMNQYDIPMIENRYADVIFRFFDKHFTSKEPDLEFMPPKDLVQAYIDEFKDGNEWVRQNFFPLREYLFVEKNMTDYKENYKLSVIMPHHWDSIAAFIADVIKSKNKTIENLSNDLTEKMKNTLRYKIRQAIVNARGYKIIFLLFVLPYIIITHRQKK